MPNWIEYLDPLHGELEIIVTNHWTGELLRHDRDHNQVQDWARHAISYLIAGRLFCTWGNHGELVVDVTPNYTVKHYKDGGSDAAADVVTATPWTYTDAMAGLIQLRTAADGDQIGATAQPNAPLYPFFPTKMRFGTGGLNADQNPRTDIPTSQTHLNAADITFPFVVVDRTRAQDSHIQMAASGSIAAVNTVTFSCKLPGGSADYPYNGKVISEAGLFCDAALKPSGSSDMNMVTGVMFAYRTFYGITKNQDIDIQLNWSFRA